MSDPLTSGIHIEGARAVVGLINIPLDSIDRIVGADKFTAAHGRHGLSGVTSSMPTDRSVDRSIAAGASVTSRRGAAAAASY